MFFEALEEGILWYGLVGKTLSGDHGAWEIEVKIGAPGSGLDFSGPKNRCDHL